MTFWTKERIELLRLHHKNGLTYEQIHKYFPEVKIQTIKKKSIELKLNFNNARNNPRFIWDDEQTELLKKLISKNKTYQEIAATLNKSTQQVRTKCDILQLRAKTSLWSTEETNLIKFLIKNNASFNQICKKFPKRSKASVRQKLKTHNLRTQQSIKNERQRLLEKEGKRKCSECNKIKNYNLDFYPKKKGSVLRSSICKLCTRNNDKKRHLALKNNFTLKQFFHRKLSQVKNRSTKKNLNFNIDEKYLIYLYKKQNKKCFYLGCDMIIEIGTRDRNRFLLTVDRINPSKGYVRGNIALCCDIANRMKTDLNYYDFSKFCEQIAKNSIVG